jgi:glycosyltransferase involved in cell wall biosynthesis
MAHLLIVEEALKNRNGHWYEYNRAIALEARHQGVTVTILAHKEIDPEIQIELDAVAFFPITSWDQVYNHSLPVIRYIGILRHNLLIARLLEAHFRQQTFPYDVVLVPTTVLYHWLAWRWLVRRGAGKWFRKVVLTTRNNAGEYDPSKGDYLFRGSARFLASVLRSFRGPVARGEVELASDSDRLAQQHSQLANVPFETYCHPRLNDGVSFRLPASGDEAVFAALGPPRYEKGSDLILIAVEKLLREQTDFPGRFIIQWNSDVYLPGGDQCVISEFLRTHPKVCFIQKSLTTEEYQAYIDDADWLLLPYRREQYHARLSGIAIEAFQSGASCICISNTWVETCMNKIGRGIAIKDDSSESLREALIQAVDINQSPMSVEQILQARKAHSPSEFVRKLGLSRRGSNQ